MPRRERDGDFIEGDDSNDHGVVEYKDGGSDHSFVGSLSEASDHVAGADDTSDHPEDPFKIQAAARANPSSDKRPSTTKQHVQPEVKMETKEDETNHAPDSDNEEASEEESGESDENEDDDDYQETSSEPNDDDDEEDYGASTPAPKRRFPSARKRKYPAAAPKSAPIPKRVPAKKSASKARAKSPNTGKPKRGRAKREKSKEEGSDEEEESDEYEYTPRHVRASKRRKSPRGKRRALSVYKVVGSSGEESNSESEGRSQVEEDESEEYEIEEQPKQPRKRKKSKEDEREECKSDDQHSKGKQSAPEKRRLSRAAARSTPQKAPYYKDFNSSDEETESGSEIQSEEEESDPKFRPKQPPKPKGRLRTSNSSAARATAKGADESQSEDEEKESEGNTSEELTKRIQGKQCARPTRSSRPSRASAAKATARIAQQRYKQEKDEEEEQEEEVKPRVQKVRKKRKVDSDEEEFQLEEEAEKEHEEADEELEDIGKLSGEESFLKGGASVRSSDSQIVGNVDSSDFNEDEVSNDDSNESTGRIRSDRRQKDLKCQNSRSAGAPDVYRCGSDSDEADFEPTLTEGRLSQEERIRPDRQHRKSSKSKHFHCPSKTDAITEDPLPQIHVCYVSADGNSRHCFSLETIHKIATTSKHPEYRTNLSEEHQLTFLQPPHFRSAMSDEMLDQVASRFGRQALDLNGSFYDKKEEASEGVSGLDDGKSDAREVEYHVRFTRSHTNTESFNTAWKMFQIKTMGSQDIYPCPLCYTVAHHRLVSAREVEGKIPLPDEFKYGPMEILGSPDNEKYEVAAGFCFKSIGSVKAHLRREHNCNTVRIGSAVFNRYKVRAPDGLLQRYLAQKNHKSPGSMRRYWYEGHSEEYVYLLYQMEKWEAHNANDSVHPTIAFCGSFQDKDVDLWERICASFSDGNTDTQDFFAGGIDAEGDDEATYPQHVFD